jgi:hypothetical protein
MVYLLDEGSVFNAPIEQVWKYLQSEQHNHPSMSSVTREISGNTATITAERTIGEKRVRMKIRNVLYPPFGMVQEHLEGPTAGSKAFLYYIPKGDKTGVTVVGDFRLEGADEQRTKDTVLAQLQIIFDEDNANLTKAK